MFKLPLFIYNLKFYFKFTLLIKHNCPVRFNFVKYLDNLFAVRKVPQRRAGGPIKKKIRTQLKIGEHDLLPTLLQQFPGLELSKQTLDNAWKKQFRQIENLTKMQNNHLQKKRTSDLKVFNI